MTTPINIPTGLRAAIFVLTMAALAGPPVSASEQNAQSGITASSAEAIRAHLDEAEDAIESLLDWRHILTGVTRGPGDSPVEPANTLISVSREEVQQLSGYINALAAMAPKPAAQSATPRGDIRAHVEKAQEIVRELLPAGASGRPVGTTGADDALVTIDRTAVERLEIELDAVERLLPRQLR